MPYVSYNQASRVALPDTMFGLYDRVDDTTDGPTDEDDYMHEPTAQNKKMDDTSWRGVFNVSGMPRLSFSVTWFAHDP